MIPDFFVTIQDEEAAGEGKMAMTISYTPLRMLIFLRSVLEPLYPEANLQSESLLCKTLPSY